MCVICIVLLKTVQYSAQQDCLETNYTSKLHLFHPLSFSSYFNFFVDENFDLSPKNLETNPNVSPDIHLRRQREMVEKWTPAKIFCRVKNHEQRIVAMFCWLGEKFPPQSWTWRIFRNIFRSRLSLFSLRSWGRILLHCCHGSYFSWWLALCHTRPAFMTTCRIVAFTASPLKRFTAAKTLLCDSAEFASVLFQVWPAHNQMICRINLICSICQGKLSRDPILEKSHIYIFKSMMFQKKNDHKAL